MSRYFIQTFHSWSDTRLQFVPDERSYGQGQNPICGNEIELVDAL